MLSINRGAANISTTAHGPERPLCERGCRRSENEVSALFLLGRCERRIGLSLYVERYLIQMQSHFVLSRFTA